MPRVSRIAAREAAAIPFPKEDTTPPVTNTYFVMAAYDTRKGPPRQITRLSAWFSTKESTDEISLTRPGMGRVIVPYDPGHACPIQFNSIQFNSYYKPWNQSLSRRIN